MRIETSVEHIHIIVLHAPDNDPFVLATRDSGTSVEVPQITVSVTTLDNGVLRPMQTSYEARGYALDKNGEPTRTARKISGSNLNRLPADVIEAIVATSEDLDVIGLRADQAKIRNPRLDAAQVRTQR